MGQATEQPTKQEFNQPSNQPNIHNIKISICRINTHAKIPNHTQKRAQLIIVKTSLKNSKNSDTDNEQNANTTKTSFHKYVTKRGKECTNEKHVTHAKYK